jgi:hypothetical protein
MIESTIESSAFLMFALPSFSIALIAGHGESSTSQPNSRKTSSRCWWFGQFRHRVRLGWNQGQMGSDPEGRIRFDVPRGELEDFIRAVRQAARETDAEYQASMARYREHAQRKAQTRREAQADQAKRARLAEDQARIDAVLAETEQ